MKLLFIGILSFIAIGSMQAQSKEEKKMTAFNPTDPSDQRLAPLLAARADESAQNLPAATVQIMQAGILEVKGDKLTETAIQVGQKAPDFTLTNAVGKKVNLYTELQKGPVVLTWYRGGWCPYCNLTLQFLQKKLPAIESAGGQLIALTPEIPDSSLSTSEKHELAFEVLSDVDNQIARTYGIVFKLGPKLAKMYEERLHLSAYNGNTKSELPLAATYIIGQDGIVKWAFLHEDYKKRAEPETIVSELKKIN